MRSFLKERLVRLFFFSFSFSSFRGDLIECRGFSMGKVHIDMALSAATGPFHFHLSDANPNTPDSES